MVDVRRATADDVDLVARVAAAGFYDDPVLSWVLDDPATRLEKLVDVFRGLVEDVVPDRGAVWIADDVSVSIWREPGFVDDGSGDDVDTDDGPSYTEGESARFAILGTVMAEAHPHEPHWYLNVVSTLPSHQGRGYGAAVIAPGLALADEASMPCYLESTNPRNRTLYRRHDFEDRDELPLEDGPSMLQMWRRARR